MQKQAKKKAKEDERRKRQEEEKQKAKEEEREWLEVPQKAKEAKQKVAAKKKAEEEHQKRRAEELCKLVENRSQRENCELEKVVKDAREWRSSSKISFLLSSGAIF